MIRHHTFDIIIIIIAVIIIREEKDKKLLRKFVKEIQTTIQSQCTRA